jgi:hypothetical protein
LHRFSHSSGGYHPNQNENPAYKIRCTT